MNLIDTDEFVKAAKLKYLGGKYTAQLILKLLRLDKINDIYSRHCHAEAQDFLDSILDELKINFDVSPEELKRIPKDGAFITVSNHPYGGIDGIFLFKYVASRRPDYKTLSTFLVRRLKPLANHMFPVNPFDNGKAGGSVAGIKLALTHLRDGHPLGIFPAGEVSSYNKDFPGICDKAWSPSVLKLIKNAGVPILPVYFEGSNSNTFHLLGRIHPMLRTVKIPSEIINKTDRTVRVRIGTPISVDQQKVFSDLTEYGHYLRAITYGLGTSMQTSNLNKDKSSIEKTSIPEISAPASQALVLNELEALRKNNYSLLQNQRYEVFCAPGSSLSHLMAELGRLREITFRQVGEGTLQSSDTDHFDTYFHQLFIWDKQKQQIAGAYRLGIGGDIIREKGIQGMYSFSLFKLSDQLLPILSQSVELGRSFVVQEYQKESQVLFLLWKGIYLFLRNNPDYRYLLGTVSISNDYSDYSKNLMVQYFKKHHFDKELARFAEPKTPFVPQYSAFKEEMILNQITNLQALSNIIRSLDPIHSPIPVLIRKYLMLKGKFIGFNVDPDFNYSLDGFIVVDFQKIPTTILNNLNKEEC